MGEAVADPAVGVPRCRPAVQGAVVRQRIPGAGTFELFTLGTLAALALLGVVGYLAAKPLRVEVRRGEQSLLADEQTVSAAD